MNPIYSVLLGAVFLIYNIGSANIVARESRMLMRLVKIIILYIVLWVPVHIFGVDKVKFLNLLNLSYGMVLLIFLLSILLMLQKKLTVHLGNISIEDKNKKNIALILMGFMIPIMITLLQISVLQKF